MSPFYRFLPCLGSSGQTGESKKTPAASRQLHPEEKQGSPHTLLPAHSRLPALTRRASSL